MKILATADTHSDLDILKTFVNLLNTGEFDAGIIAGDMTEGWDITRRPTLIEFEVKAVLARTDVPILVVPGNHDMTAFGSFKNIVNIQMKSHSIGDVNFVGFSGENIDPITAEFMLAQLGSLMGEKTIFVSHAPPLGILDSTSQPCGRWDIEYDEYYHHGKGFLKAFVEKFPPLFHVFGHLHRSAGKWNNFINVTFPFTKCFWTIDTDTGMADFLQPDFGVCEVSLDVSMEV